MRCVGGEEIVIQCNGVSSSRNWLAFKQRASRVSLAGWLTEGLWPAGRAVAARCNSLVLVTCLLAACAGDNGSGASRHRLGLCRPYRAWSRGGSILNCHGCRCLTPKALLQLGTSAVTGPPEIRSPLASRAIGGSVCIALFCLRAGVDDPLSNLSR